MLRNENLKMKRYNAHPVARLFPLLAACTTAFAVTGCGGGGGSISRVSPLPEPISMPAPVVVPPDATPTPVPVETPVPLPTPATSPSPSPDPTPTPVASPTPGPVLEAPDADEISASAEESINRLRAASGLAPLRHHEKLADVAQAYARRMGTEGFFSHNDPEGRTVLDRVTGAGYRWRIVGENLARVKTKPGNEANFTVNGWMNSEKHRANILRPEYTESAVGIARTADGTTYLVQIFATPG
jgi:uncharacterized protein YkwD